MNQPGKQELDEQLKQLAITAQKHPPTTEGRRVALTKLINGILSSGKLFRPAPSRLPSNFFSVYEEIYDEAKQELMLHVCQKIHEYDPERSSVLRWVNYLMDRRFFYKAIGNFRDRRENRVSQTIPTLDELDNFEPENISLPEPTPLLSEIIRGYIEEDPEGILRTACIESHPQATFQVLLLKRLAGESLQKIAKDLGVAVPTLSSFYQRTLKKLAQKIQDDLLQ
jgi:RNA polymerase sigma factor (sigma-70 family)